MHQSEKVQAAITKLCDALCEFERATGRQSAFVIREDTGFFYRALNGKPGVPSDISDEDLLIQASPEEGGGA